MRRRDFTAGLILAAVTGRAQAQQTGKVYQIAFAHATVPVADQNQASKGSLANPDNFRGIDPHVGWRNLLIERYSRLPTIYPFRQFVEAGGLMSYSIDISDVGHRVADLADKTLKAAKPGEIPIFQPTKFELSINLKAARTLGIEFLFELSASRLSVSKNDALNQM